MNRVSLLAFAAALAACSGPPNSDLFVNAFGDASPSGVDSGRDGGGDAAGPDAKVSPDAGSPVIVHCGASECAGPSLVCCRPANDADGGSDTCITQAACAASKAMPIPCDDTVDCATLSGPGQVCCVTATTTGAAEVLCRPMAQCTNDLGRSNLCDPRVPNACPNGGSCKASESTLPGYYLCIK